MKLTDRISWKAKWTFTKFKNDESGVISNLLKMGAPINIVKEAFPENLKSVEVVDFNLALNEGLGELIDIICGLGTPTLFDNTNAYIGVGDSSTSEAATQTGLQASTNKYYKAMDVSYPQRSNQTAEWRATFGSSDANFAWNEFTVANGNSDSAKNLNRKVASKGTKESGETWTVSLQILFS
jgi:hypothetical protein